MGRSGRARGASGDLTPSHVRIAREIRRRRTGIDEDAPDPPEPSGPGAWLREHVRTVVVAALVVPAFALLLLESIEPRSASARAWSSALLLAVDFPARHRRGATDTVAVRVSNRSTEPIPAVSLRIDGAYLAAFADVAFTPAADARGGVVLRDLRSGETREVRVRVTAADVGRHDGRVIAAFDDARVAAALHTLVLP